MLNKQAPEKRQTMYQNGHERLDVHSIFYTIQGEGPFCGTPAVFIRLAGCNLQCPACDTNYTIGRVWMDTDRILEIVRERAPGFSGLIVITGGEPFRQEIDLLVLKLIQRFGCYVQVETNGSLAPPELSVLNKNTEERKGFYIVCSPKAGKVHPKTAEAACAYKYVMAAHSVDPEDGLPILALDHTAHPRVSRPPAGARVYLQPVDAQDPYVNRANLEACVKSCQKHGYILQLQIHKLIGVE